jgi:hypothetical protein
VLIDVVIYPVIENLLRADDRDHINHRTDHQIDQDIGHQITRSRGHKIDRQLNTSSDHQITRLG